MTSFEVEVNDKQFSKTKVSCVEFPEYICKYENFEEKMKIDSSLKEVSFKYHPIPGGSDRLSISSNLQNRNIIALKIKRDSHKLVKSAQFVGIVQDFHVFRELFDFSAETEYELNISNQMRKASKTYDTADIENITNIFAKNNDAEHKIDMNSFCIPPFKFSQISLPLSGRDFRSSLKLSSKDDTLSQEKSWNVSFDYSTVPTGPSEECICRARNIPQSQIDAVVKIFDERPIVSKIFLQNKISDPSIKSNLKLILPLIAYHWKNGPWHLLWTKYNCDPRSDPKYRFFQSIELRNKMFAKELRRGKALSNNQASPKLPTVDQLPGYCFDGKILILNYLTYQYVDLTYTPLQEIVNYPGGIRLGASEKEGWYPEGTAKKLRDLMKFRWFELLKSMDLKDLPQSKIEEILEATAPSSLANSPISSEWNIFNRIPQIQNSNATVRDYKEEDDDDEENENSDYEIFDY